MNLSWTLQPAELINEATDACDQLPRNLTLDSFRSHFPTYWMFDGMPKFRKIGFDTPLSSAAAPHPTLASATLEHLRTLVDAGEVSPAVLLGFYRLTLLLHNITTHTLIDKTNSWPKVNELGIANTQFRHEIDNDPVLHAMKFFIFNAKKSVLDHERTFLEKWTEGRKKIHKLLKNANIVVPDKATPDVPDWGLHVHADRRRARRARTIPNSGDITPKLISQAMINFHEKGRRVLRARAYRLLQDGPASQLDRAESLRWEHDLINVMLQGEYYAEEVWRILSSRSGCFHKFRDRKVRDILAPVGPRIDSLPEEDAEEKDILEQTLMAISDFVKTALELEMYAGGTMPRLT